MPSASIFGREAELTAIADLLATPPAAVVIEGEPGIGKTTVWEAGVAAAHARVLSCRAAGTEVQLSFAALGDLLAPVLADVLPGLPPPRRRALEVALLLEDPDGPAPERRAVGLAVFDCLRLLVEQGPVLVAVDDAHWLDDETAHALTFALRRLDAEPVMVLAAVRAGEAPAFTAEHTSIGLGPLDSAALYRLVRDRLGIALPRPLLTRVHETSGGNPFYALELARALGDRSSLDAGERLPLSASLQALLAARLDDLSSETRKALLAAALLAQPTVTAIGRRKALEAAAAAGVITLDGDRVSFGNPLVAAAVEACAEPDARRAMHRELAEVAGDAETRARHRALGATGPDEPVAAELDGAALAALARGAPEAGAELLTLAAQLTPPAQAEERRRRLLQAADAYVTAGALADARTVLDGLLAELGAGEERAAVLLRLGTLADDLAQAQPLLERARREASDDGLLAGIHLALGSAWPLHGIEHALDNGRTALRHAERSGDDALVVHVLARLALWMLWAGRSPAKPLERALVHGRRPGEFPDDSPVFALGLWQLYRGDLDDAREAFQGLADRAADAGDDVDWLALRGRLAEVELRAGRWQEALAHADAAYELAEQLGLNVDGGLSAYWKSLVEAHIGNADDARAAAAAGATVAREATEENTLVMSLGAVGFLDLSLGDDKRALANLRPLLDWLMPRQLALATHPLGPYAIEALVGVGELDEADELIDQLRREALRIQSPWALAVAARLRGTALAAAADLDAAAGALESAVARHRGWPFERARTLFELGRVRRRRKEKAAARTALEGAIEVFDALPAAVWAGRGRAELERVGLRQGASDELTATERRVAQLAASGLKNHEVAAQLFVSPKTVEANLARAYRKLGIRSRAELGARLAQESAPM